MIHSFTFSPLVGRGSDRNSHLLTSILSPRGRGRVRGVLLIWKLGNWNYVENKKISSPHGGGGLFFSSLVGDELVMGNLIGI
jgi:hypothetical protein